MAGKKVNTKGDRFNIGRSGHEESAGAQELQPLLQKEKLDDQRKVGMPMGYNSMIEETDLISDEPGPSQITEFKKPLNSFEDSNQLKHQEFKKFLKYIRKFNGLDLSSKSGTQRNSDLFANYANDYYLDKLDIISLRNKLGYLTDNEKTLLKKHDFRSVSSSVEIPNSFICSLAGIMKINTKVLQKLILGKEKPFDPEIGKDATASMELLKNRNVLKYGVSDRLNSLDDLKNYLKTNLRKFKDKHILLKKMESDKMGSVVVLKYKMVHDNPNPIMFYVDYTYPGFIQPDFPNPYRFRTYIKTEQFNYFYVYVLELLK